MAVSVSVSNAIGAFFRAVTGTPAAFFWARADFLCSVVFNGSQAAVTNAKPAAQKPPAICRALDPACADFNRREGVYRFILWYALTDRSIFSIKKVGAGCGMFGRIFQAVTTTTRSYCGNTMGICPPNPLPRQATSVLFSPYELSHHL